jgi:hypothetical protein
VTIDELLRTLSERHIELYVDAGRLRFRAPTGALTDELRGVIASQRIDLIAKLTPATKRVDCFCIRCDPRDWIDAPARDGRIRTTCRVCGRFIGYRKVVSIGPHST